MLCFLPCWCPVSDDAEAGEDAGSHLTQHGIDMEPVIHEAYDLLTGQKTRESGFWTLINEQNPLKSEGISKSWTKRKKEKQFSEINFQCL